MLTLPSAATTHLAKAATRLTVAGYIQRGDGTIIRCTQHDQDLVISTGDLAGTYASVAAITASDIRSTSDGSVDNLEVEGYFQDAAVFSGFTVQDVEAGLFNNAPFETFLCQWDDPNAWQKRLRRGYLGEINRTAEGAFTAEWRGLGQLLQQQVGRTYGERCDVKAFGDARCGFNAATLTVTGTVTAVTSRRRFNATLSGGVAGRFNLGRLLFTTGPNADDYPAQVKYDAVSATLGNIELWESLPFDVSIGETFTLAPGCDRRWETCQGFSNTVNFRGHGRWMPGIPQIIRAP